MYPGVPAVLLGIAWLLPGMLVDPPPFGSFFPTSWNASGTITPNDALSRLFQHPSRMCLKSVECVPRPCICDSSREL